MIPQLQYSWSSSRAAYGRHTRSRIAPAATRSARRAARRIRQAWPSRTRPRTQNAPLWTANGPLGFRPSLVAEMPEPLFTRSRLAAGPQQRPGPRARDVGRLVRAATAGSRVRQAGPHAHGQGLCADPCPAPPEVGHAHRRPLNAVNFRAGEPRSKGSPQWRASGPSDERRRRRRTPQRPPMRTPRWEPPPHARPRTPPRRPRSRTSKVEQPAKLHAPDGEDITPTGDSPHHNGETSAFRIRADCGHPAMRRRL